MHYLIKKSVSKQNAVFFLDGYIWLNYKKEASYQGKEISYLLQNTPNTSLHALLPRIYRPRPLVRHVHILGL